MELIRVTWGKGMNSDVLPYELPDGYCSNAVNARFRNGFAERVGGSLDASISYISSVATPPDWMELYPSALSATGRFLVYAGTTTVFADNISATKTDITRYTQGASISSITRVGTTATLTTSSNHGRINGDTVSVWGAVPSQYNGTYVIGGVTATTFTYTMASDPGASAAPVGLYSYNGVTSLFPGTSGSWSGGSLNGVLIVNHATSGLYYWNGDITTHLRKFPVSNVSDTARVFKNYIVQLASTVNGTKQNHNVAWSAAAAPGTIPASFTATATNDAGNVDLAETSGSVIDCMPWGDLNIVFKEDGRFGMQYIGGNDKFRFYRLPGTEGLLNKGCIANTPKGQVFLTANLDVMIHTGGVATSIAQGRVRNLLATIPAANKNNAFLCVNPYANEVWVFYPAPGDTYPKQALIWNWDDDTWGQKADAFGMRCATSGLLTSSLSGQYMVLGRNSLSIGFVDLSSTDFGLTFISTIERQGLTFGDSDSIKFLSRSRWQMDGQPSYSLTVYHGSAMTADASPVYAAATAYTPGTTNFCNARATGGSFLAVKAELPTTTANKPTLVRSCELEFAKGGRR